MLATDTRYTPPPEAFACRCEWPLRRPRPCTRRMTQEDLLCDTCRRGCATLSINGGPDIPHSDVRSELLWP